MSASCIERNKSSTGNNSNENSNKITNKKQKTPFAKSRNLFKNIMCTVVFVVLVVVFFSPELYCAQFYCIFPSLLFSLVFFIRIYIVDIFGISIHTLLLFRSQLPSLCRSLMPRSPTVAALFDIALSLSHFTQIRYALVHVHVHLLLFIACERVLLSSHSLNATTDALSLSLALSYSS